MHVSYTATLLGGILSLAGVVTASPVPDIDERAVSTTDPCQRKDVVIVSRLLRLSSKPQQICANFVPVTKPSKGVIVKAGRDLESLDQRDTDEQLDTRAVNLPAALKRYGTALITQSCKCLYPQEQTPPVTTPVTVITFETVQGFPPGQGCFYPLYTGNQLGNYDPRSGYTAVAGDCQGYCRSDSQCQFVWISKDYRTVDDGFGGSTVIEVAQCYRSDGPYSESKVSCGGPEGTNAVVGYNKITTTT